MEQTDFEVVSLSWALIEQGMKQVLLSPEGVLLKLPTIRVRYQVLGHDILCLEMRTIENPSEFKVQGIHHNLIVDGLLGKNACEILVLWGEDPDSCEGQKDALQSLNVEEVAKLLEVLEQHKDNFAEEPFLVLKDESVEHLTQGHRKDGLILCRQWTVDVIHGDKHTAVGGIKESLKGLFQ